MLFLGGIEEAKITCPSQLQMNWNYTYDAGSGNVCGDAYLDVCTNTGLLDFDYTKCTQTQAYSSKSIIDSLCSFNIIIINNKMILMIRYSCHLFSIPLMVQLFLIFRSNLS